MNITKTLAEQAIEMPIFAMFLFAYKNFARTKRNSDNTLNISFGDGSFFTMTNDGTMTLTFLVSSSLPFSDKPSIWIDAVSESDAIAKYKSLVETYHPLNVCLPFLIL